MKSVRIERINSELKKVIGSIIDNDLRDPQINSIITVTEVETSPDLSTSHVYISCFGQTPKEEVLNRIKGAAGFIRGRVSKEIKLRITPRLEFKLDNSLEYSSKIENILKTVKYSTEADDDNN